MWNKLLIFICLSLLTGCGGAGANYYRLSAMTASPTGGSSSGLSVAVGPVTLPSYIDRAEIVFSSGSNQFQIPTNALWVGSLQENISRVVAADLGALLGTSNVRASVEPGFSPRYRVALDVRQFHGISGQEAIFDLSWRIQGGASGETISRHSRMFQQGINGDGYQALVEAESRLLEQASAAIAQSLR